MNVKSWKEGSAGEPSFPSDFEVIKNAVLQVTDIETNRNKYYSIELHRAKGGKFRVYTHYGRTDDLDTNPDAGIRESRYLDSLAEAEGVYDQIYRQKTSARKGYKEVNLASSKIGSQKVRGKSSGVVDQKTIDKLKSNGTKKTAKKIPTVILDPSVQDLVALLYGDATKALTSAVNATITANGIETPLGVLTMGQIDKGQDILDNLSTTFQSDTRNKQDLLVKLSGEFYTVIPHRFGRSRSAAEAAVINTAQQINDKNDTLQLMRDMLNVNGAENVLVNPEIEQKYLALGCNISTVDAATFKQIKDLLEKSVVKSWSKVKVQNVWKIDRPSEVKNFTTTVKNKRNLFHGSSAKNWVGILSRGLLMPKTVVSLGVKRTDAGWLGNGIYFGDAACTSAYYAGPSKRNTRFIAVADVALGKMKDFRKITYGLNSPPQGYDSCHGVRGSEFDDDEYVIYNQNQQKLKYLVECKQ